MTPEELNVARTLGINETVMMQLWKGQEVKCDRFILDRFYLTLILNDLLKDNSFWKVSETYHCNRGAVQNLLARTMSFVSSVQHFVQELNDFWQVSESLTSLNRKLSTCCLSEFMPLLALPCVANGRARLLYDAGFRSLIDVAKSDPDQLVRRIDHLPKTIAHYMVSTARLLVLDKVDMLRDEADSLLEFIPKARIEIVDETVSLRDLSTEDD